MLDAENCRRGVFEARNTLGPWSKRTACIVQWISAGSIPARCRKDNSNAALWATTGMSQRGSNTLMPTRSHVGHENGPAAAIDLKKPDRGAVWIETGTFSVGFLCDQGLKVSLRLAHGRSITAQLDQGSQRATRHRLLVRQGGQPLPLAFVRSGLNVDGDNTVLGVGEDHGKGR